MTRLPSDVTDAELRVLQALWQHGTPATMRQLTELLHPERRDEPSTALKSETASILKLLERLEAKGYVRRNRRERVQVFEAAVDREGLLGRWLDVVAGTLYDGALAPLLTNLISSKRLTVHERASLRALLDELATPTKKPRNERRQ
jgi:predicted transcriptional regulator